MRTKKKYIYIFIYHTCAFRGSSHKVLQASHQRNISLHGGCMLGANTWKKLKISHTGNGQRASRTGAGLYGIHPLQKTTKNKLMCYPQQLGRSWKVFVPEPSGTLSAMCTGQLSNFVCYLHRNHPELHGPSAPGPSELDQPSGTLQNLTVRDLIRHLHRNLPELCLLCAPDSSATLSAICTGTIRNFMGHLHRDPPNLISHPEPSSISSAIYARTVQNLISFLPEPLRRNTSEPYLQSAPELSGTSSAFCPETLRNLISHLRRNPPETCLLPAPEPSGTSSASCPGTVRNLISHLHRNQQSAPEGSGTLWNLLRNLVLQLHRIAPELFWAKDPIANFAVGEQNKQKISFGVSPTAVAYEFRFHVCLHPRLFFWRGGFAHVDNVITKRCSKQPHGCSCQGCKTTSLALSGTFRNLPQEPTPEHTGTLRNLPPEPTPELSGTFRTCLQQPTSTGWNSPEPSGTCLRNLHPHKAELFGTFHNCLHKPAPAHAGTLRNLPPEPTPAHAGTLRNLPLEPIGQHTPELSDTFWNTDRNSPQPPGTFLRNLFLWPAPAHTGAYLGWRPR